MATIAAGAVFSQKSKRVAGRPVLENKDVLAAFFGPFT
jgi:hypothetical protein